MAAGAWCGRAALLVKYRDRDAASALPYVAALHVPDVGLGREGVKLTLVARGAREPDRERAIRMVRSVRFTAPAPGSDEDSDEP